MSSAPVATFSGLASGIQWQDTVDLLIQIESQPIYRLQDQKSDQQARIDAWNSIQGKLTALQSAAQAIDAASELLAMNASSSNSDIISATAGSGAFAATHSVQVNQLAQQEVFVHDTGWSDLTSSSLTASGTVFAYQFDGGTYSITLPAGSTLADLIDAINEDENNPGVTASAIDDGTDTDPYHLVLTADEAAAANSIGIDDGLTTIGGGVFDSAGWVRTKDAQQAQIRVDGYPPADWITRDSNTVDDVIEGVTLTLKDVTLTDVQITVTEDYTETKDAINNWVSAYNALMTDIAAKTQYDSEAETRGVLMGDSALQQLKSDVMMIAADEIPGVSSSSPFKTIGSVGLDLTSGGKITVDDSALQDALEADPHAVADLFAVSDDSSSPYISFFKQEAETVGGEYEVTLFYLANGTIDPAANNTIGGYPATVDGGHILVGKAGTPVEGLRLYFDGPGGGAGSINATVRLGKGVASQFDGLVETVNDSVDGLIKQAKDSYQSVIDSLDKQIEAYQNRIAIKRDILMREFQAMETAVSQAQAQAGWIGQ